MATNPAPPKRNLRVEAAEATRAKLIESGLALAEESGLEGLTVNAIVGAAGVSKGSFFHHFPDRATYLVAMHRRFHDALSEEMGAVLGDMPPGAERLEVAARTYLDGCLRDRGVKALLLEARGHRPIADEVMRRNEVNVAFIAADFEALGRSHARQEARLWVAAAAETALIELENRGPDAAAREALRAFTPRASPASD